MIRLKLLALHLAYRVQRFVRGSIRSLREGLDFLFGALAQLAQVLVSRYVIGFVFIAFIVLIAPHRREAVGSFNTINCENNDLKVHISAPKFFASNEEIRFHVVVRNATSRVLRRVEVSIWTEQDLWFPDGNRVVFKTVEGNEITSFDIKAQAIPTKTISFHPVVQYQYEGKNQKVSCTPVEDNMTFSHWRNVVLSFRNIPQVSERVIKILGTLTALGAAWLTLFGKWQEVLRRLEQWMRSTDKHGKSQGDKHHG